ncbi:hypothetical protein HPT29_026455 (plasmid) [Microvirga terrae]|uniref:DUF6647 domain-containing protein n=1 Tax=Microvirga terrae TaxID=2740529 RepID=A0ABY5RZ46_9HYPH|nr:DUF6647 family protein [Microvirga terrae]UVF22229.1 hypothetical protein HPT29_026455 [Microvirga terrae]
MRKACSLQGHDDTIGSLWDALRLARMIALVACGLALALAAIGPALARSAGSDECLESEWIAEARAFVIGETGIQAPEICVRLAPKERLDGLVFPMTLGESHSEAVAAVYVPTTREILLADDLDPDTPLARSYLVHELVHAQQFASRAHERASCPGALEADAYGLQALYLRTRGLREEAFLLQVLGLFQGACGYSD